MVTSANVACGFHAGDPTTLRETCRSAVERGVVIGAQVGYPDLVGFGRRFLDIPPMTWLRRWSTRSAPWTRWPARSGAGRAT